MVDQRIGRYQILEEIASGGQGVVYRAFDPQTGQIVARLAEVEPNDYEYVITPTGDELPEMYEHWKRLGALLGKPLKPITSGYSLQELIRKWNALPNWRQRWCTRVLKIEPFNAYLMANLPATTYVGLRADEPEDIRRGTIFGGVEGITQRYPLREWGWGINDVRLYLEGRGVSIPQRTDCARCFFQRAGEWYELWRKHPDLYEEAVADEERTGYTFRKPGGHKDRHPVGLADLRRSFERDNIPRGAGQISLFSDNREDMCRVCSL